MYTNTLVVAAFAALTAALPTEQNEQNKECYPQCGEGAGGVNWNSNSWSSGYQKSSQVSGSFGIGGGAGAGAGWQGGWNQPQVQANAWSGGNGFGSNAGFQQTGQWQQNQPGAWGSAHAQQAGWQQQAQYGGAGQQLPLTFAGQGQQQVPIGQLYPYQCKTDKISFGGDIKLIINVHDIKCKVFSDADGHDQIGSQFGYDEPCEFDDPTEIQSILCEIN